MEYITLDNQQNTYPSTRSYKKSLLDTIVLTGNYAVNKIDFKLPNLDNIKIVQDTNFRFLLAIKENANSEPIGLYTSPLYYNELVTSYNESNPYFIQNSFLDEFIVTYNIDDIKTIFSDLQLKEKVSDVRVSKNLFILDDGTYDYNALVRYIDWIVAAVKLSELGTNGVLPLSEIASYTLPTSAKTTKPSDGSDANNTNTNTKKIFEYRIEFISSDSSLGQRIGDPVRAERARFGIYAEKDKKSIRVREPFKFGDTFFGVKTSSTYLDRNLPDITFYWYEVYDNSKTNLIGYSYLGDTFTKITELSGPYEVAVVTPPQMFPPATPSTPSFGGGSSGGGGGPTMGRSDYGGGYNNQNNIRYNQR
jgi:hypothetical protein